MSIPKKIDPEALYDVKVCRVIKRGEGMFLRPNQPCRVKGKVLKEIAADVLDAMPYTPKLAGECHIPQSRARIDER